jgi:hypothetical protein
MLGFSFVGAYDPTQNYHYSYISSISIAMFHLIWNFIICNQLCNDTRDNDTNMYF